MRIRDHIAYSLIKRIFGGFQMPRCRLRASRVSYGAITVKLSIRSITKPMLVSSSSPDAGLVGSPVALSTVCSGDSSASILATQREANSWACSIKPVFFQGSRPPTSSIFVLASHAVCHLFSAFLMGIKVVCKQENKLFC